MSMTMTEERSPKPYGDVAYADPKNGKYPIDTEAHIRAAWSYINMPKNAAVYPLNGVTLESVKSKIRAAMKRIGADVEESNSADRAPFELRKRRRASMIRQAERRGMLLEVRAKPDGTGGTDFVFEGYGAVFDSPFEMWDRWGEPYTEVVKPGAFTRSLQRSDLDVPFLIGHDETRLALARTRNGTMQLSQDSKGLSVRAVLDGRRSDVRDLAYAVERGDMDEMSIGFVTMAQSWSDDFETRSMLDLEMHRGDVSPVSLAANPATAGSTVAVPAEHLARRAAVSVPAGSVHAPMTGTHVHEHPPFAQDDGTGPHTHEHDHADDADHDHMHPQVGANTRSARPGERRANPVDQNLGDSPDYNPWKNTPGAQQCTNCQRMASPAANFCDGCGSGGDALIRVNDDGVPGMTEEHGETAQLALRRRQLELLALRR